MKVVNGGVSMTKAEVDALEAEGFLVSWHTPYYLNHIKVKSSVMDSDGNHFTIGFYNWLDNLDCYIGDDKITVRDKAHLKEILKLMRAFKKVNEMMVSVK